MHFPIIHPSNSIIVNIDMKKIISQEDNSADTFNFIKAHYKFVISSIIYKGILTNQSSFL